ncbi:MAG TPA: ferric reductase-like transmembrane domain-containing protein [Frankiaceae bacterium]|nr:ferric reductase-like transmembrane domain-containing protein [Frankiaceae bacterium]
MTNAQLDVALWYLGRGSGVVALVLLTASVLLGIVTRSGRPLPGLPRFAVAEVHRSIGLLSVAFLAVHVLTLTLDPKAQMRWLNVIIPFVSSWRPLWTGLGTLALDLLVALLVTSLLRERLGHVVWRAVHWASYALWPFAVLHTLGSGTDIGHGWLTLVLGACVLAVALAGVWRLSDWFLDPSDRLPGSKRPQPSQRTQPPQPSQRQRTSYPEATFRR